MNLSKTIQKINSTLDKIIFEDLKILSAIKKYIIQSGGKRIRPLLLIFLTELLDYKAEPRWIVASITELIHAASLLHDDVVDNAETRRGKPTVGKLYGNKTAILTGDYLLACGIFSLNQLKSPELMDVFTKVIKDLSVSELLQMEWEKNPKITEPIYSKIIYGKTSSLFGAACQSAAILAKLNKKKELLFYEFGIQLGNLFQKRDDCLDYFQVLNHSGKDFLKDFYNQLYTYPLIVLKQVASKKDKESIPRILQTKNEKEILNLIDKYNLYDKLRYTLNQEIDQCIQFLNQFPEKKERKLLEEQIISLKLP